MLLEASVICPLEAEAETIRDYSITHFNSVAELNQSQWNKLIPESNFLMKTDYLGMLESVQGSQMDFRYLLVNHKDSLIGLMYFQVVRFNGGQLINYFPDSRSFFMKGLRNVSERLLNSINAKLLVSGNVFMTGENGLYFTQNVDKTTRAKILRRAVREIMQRDKAVNAVLISDLYEPKTDFDKSFPICGYHEITVESDMSIYLRDEWQNMDDYLKALSSKYRVRAKRVFALCNENGVYRKDLKADDIALYERELYALYLQVMEGVDFKLAELSKDYFRVQKQEMPDNYHVFAYFKDGEMIGFISAFLIGKKMEVHYTGMAHDVSKPIHLYQHMMYDMVEFGILHRAERLHFGRTAPEIKSTIGAKPSPMYGYLKHRNPFINFFLMGPYTRNLKPKKYAIREPFKS